MNSSEPMTEASCKPTVSVPLRLPFRVWWALFLVCGLAANVFGDALFDDLVIVAMVGAGVAIVLVARLCSSGADDDGGVTAWILTGCRGLMLGALLFLASVVSGALADLLTRGRSGETTMWFARLLLALFVGSIILLLLRRPIGRVWNYVRLSILWLLGAGAAVALVLFVIYTGPADLSVYPPAAESPYRLPWKPGTARLCNQGNRAIVSHRGWEEFAYDFHMPVGTEVCAARGGWVVRIVDHHDGNGLWSKNNEILISHEDSTFGQYLHHRQGGARVKLNQRVAQGDVICESGNVGYSMAPHLHFQVMDIVDGKWQTIPITFADVPGDGIPRIWRRYRSGS